MTTFPNLITDNCNTKRTAQLVAQSIPILVRWAENGITTNTYGDLIKELGMTKFSGIGYTLGCIEDVLSALRKKTGKSIPTLNALIRGKDGLPSSGFKYVYPDYDSYPKNVKKALVDAENAKTIKYDNWDTVLQLLCLKPSVINTQKDEEAIRTNKHTGIGEGPQHKELKEYIYKHPESIGIRNVVMSDTEYTLLSGDRIDVYFELKNGTRIAVEVKSIISADDDILRGLFQCVKYKSILDAENKIHGLLSNNLSLLVLEGTLSESNQQVKDSLGINVIEGFIKG